MRIGVCHCSVCRDGPVLISVLRFPIHQWSGRALDHTSISTKTMALSSPGFRLGFPNVQRKVFDTQTAKNAYLMITAAGRRVELRQVGTSNIYDAADSSYLRLTEDSAVAASPFH